MTNRTATIMQLASAMGHGAAVETLHGPSRYDAGTKTLYCNGQVITSATMEDAKKYYEDQKVFFRSGPNAALPDAGMYITFCDIAINAINWMMEQPNDLGR